MFSKAILATALISAVSAHQNMHQIWINDVTPGYQTGIRMPPSNSPVEDVTSNDMACNVGGSKVPSGVDTIPANEGDTIKVQWDQSGHPGPITHFLFGPVDDASQETGIGAGWFKIDEVDNVDGKWANEIMGANNMTREFALPTGLASGEYLLRSEMLALHGAQTVGGAQFYIGCAQLKITGTGSGSCGPTISIPGAYKAEDANIYIPNVYNGFDATTYSAPGGPIATCGGASGATPSKPSAAPIPAPLNSTIAAGPTAVAPIASSAVVVAETSAIAPVIPTLAPAPAPTAGNNTIPTAAPVIPIPSTFATLVRPTPDAPVVAPTGGSAAPTGAAGAAKMYYQCGGIGFKGPNSCEGALRCVVMNPYYSQCLA
ncbi:carbohydrate-binding module family 1 protein [Plenodomus tracheiphilus IPT5]|uniref:AA9 family lytic polysaccharide monooxygenase n=1 Tax=Plenodomus tracheiphilus IPT5 TaxID=1408161 RepID=A0A6A7AWJ3_9PLEO|nr:carbohydrate-binding module family 1 protein [Plenodomus tracheiphilus IPT5]